VVLNGEIGSKATVVTGNAAVNTLNNNRTVYYGNMNYLTETYLANNEIANLAVTGNEIFIRDDITTYLDQTYTGHVQIGNNGTMVNGVLKTSVSLMSVDPTISFVGRSVLYAATELGAVIYKQSEEKYSFDDEFATPTHSLSLSAKGACWVSGGSIVACQNTGKGNIYKGLDENNQDTAYYNALRPLASLTQDNVTMLFPRGFINNNIDIGQLAIPEGSITDGAGSVSTESIAYRGALSQRAFESGPPPPAPVVGVGERLGGRSADADARVARASKVTGGGVLGRQVKPPKSSNPIKTMNLEYNSDVVIGTVRSSFSDSGFDDLKIAPSGSSNGAKNKKVGDPGSIKGVKASFDEDAGASGSFDNDEGPRGSFDEADNISEETKECDAVELVKC
jgi:fibronectin-binding autotransporter adhesin